MMHWKIATQHPFNVAYEKNSNEDKHKEETVKNNSGTEKRKLELTIDGILFKFK